MPRKTILNRIEKQKGFVCDRICWSDDGKSLLIRIRPHGRSRPVCSVCRRKGPCYDTRSERRFEFVPLWAIPVFFVYRLRRVDCPDCGVKVERVPWSDGKHRTTRSDRVFLSRWAKRLSWKETADIFGTSWETVFRAVRWVVRWGIANQEIRDVEAIGIDEIQSRRGHRSLTLVDQVDAGRRRLLYVARDRTKESLRGFFRAMPKSVVSSLKFVCTDMWKHSLTVIADECSHAVNILDRFHVMKKCDEEV